MDVHELLTKLSRQQEEGVEKFIIPYKELKTIINKAKELLAQESNVQPVQAPVNICGNIHGKFFDLLNLFQITGEIKNGNSYIFTGGYVSRGYNSVETIEYLLCLKVAYPDRVTLLRGKHESRCLGQCYGFYDEIQRKYGNSNPWKLFTDLFDYLPIAALVEGQILCIHGGLSPEINTIDQIRTIDRNQEIPMDGPFFDLIWNDPCDQVDMWQYQNRQGGYFFGGKVVDGFNRLNCLSLICRGNQMVQEGFEYKFDKKLVTVWSSPNYQYRMGNKGAVLKINDNLDREEIQFEEVEINEKIESNYKVLPYFV